MNASPAPSANEGAPDAELPLELDSDLLVCDDDAIASPQTPETPETTAAPIGSAAAPRAAAPPSSRREPALPSRRAIGLALVAALGLIAPSKLLADRCAARCREQLALVLGPDVQIGALRMSPLGVTLEDVQSSTATVERLSVAIAPFKLLLGRVQIARVAMERIRIGELGTARTVHLSRTPRGWHGVVEDVAHRSAGGGLTAAELSFDLIGRAPERIAFLGATLEHPLLGTIHELQGQLRAAGDGAWKGRIAAPGIEATLEASKSEQQIAVQLDRSPLVLPLGKGLVEQPPVVSGTIELQRDHDGTVQLVLGLRLSGMILRHRLLSAHTVGPIELQVGGDLGLRPRTTGGWELATNALTLRHGELTLTLKGRASSDDVHLEVRLPKTSCAAILESVPQGFLARLASLPLAGEVAGRFALDGEWSTIGESGVALDLDFQCKTIAEAPLGDPTKLGPLGAPIPEGLVDPALRPAKFAPLAIVPATVIRALLESEDSRFFQHAGFDVPLLRRALAFDVTERRLVRGASTLSQQLVKNLYLSGERTVERKLEEAFLTWRLEATTKKERILELYLNLVDFGAPGRGIAQASRHWFNKPTSELTLDEAAELVSLLPAPSRGKDDKWRERLASLRGRLKLSQH